MVAFLIFVIVALWIIHKIEQNRVAKRVNRVKIAVTIDMRHVKNDCSPDKKEKIVIEGYS